MVLSEVEEFESGAHVRVADSKLPLRLRVMLASVTTSVEPTKTDTSQFGLVYDAKFEIVSVIKNGVVATDSVGVVDAVPLPPPEVVKNPSTPEILVVFCPDILAIV